MTEASASVCLLLATALNGGIWKQKFHSQNVSNVLEFRPHYAGGI